MIEAMAFFSSTKKIKPAKRLTGSVRLPGDKSISHRYAMLAAIAEGPSEVHYFSSRAPIAEARSRASRNWARRLSARTTL